MTTTIQTFDGSKLRGNEYYKKHFQWMLSLIWKHPKPKEVIDKSSMGADDTFTACEHLWVDHLGLALSARYGYPLPTVLTWRRHLGAGSSWVCDVELAQKTSKYKTRLTIPNDKKFKVEVWTPMGGSKPYYVRDGVIAKNEYGYRARNLPTRPFYGQRTGVDPLMIGHKYPE